MQLNFLGSKKCILGTFFEGGKLVFVNKEL